MWWAHKDIWCASKMWLFREVIERHSVKNRSLNKKRSYLKQNLREYFTRTLHGIHKNDEGLCIKFHTTIMRGVYYVLSRIWATIIMSNDVKLLINKAYLQLPRFGKMVIDMENSIFQKHCGFSRRMKNSWTETTRTMVSCKQGFRLPTRHECMGWFAQIDEEPTIHHKTGNIITEEFVVPKSCVWENHIGMCAL